MARTNPAPAAATPHPDEEAPAAAAQPVESFENPPLSELLKSASIIDRRLNGDGEAEE